MAMLSHAQGKGPRCVIFTPAKELALQIAEVAQRLAANTDLRVEVVYGGVGHQRPARDAWKPGVTLVVATPGRFHGTVSAAMLSSPKTCRTWSWTKPTG